MLAFIYFLPILYLHFQIREVGQQISSIFWSRKFWLPSHLSWEDLQSRVDVKYADPTEIWVYPIIIAIIFTCFRHFILNTFITAYLAKWIGVNTNVRYPPPYNKHLEKMFKRHGIQVPTEVLKANAKEVKTSVENIVEWLRQRNVCDRPSKYIRFQDVIYILIYHTAVTVLCIGTVYDRPWLYDISLCFKNYPHHSIDDRIWWLYMVSLGFYWSQTFWQLISVRTKDTKLMVTHHVSTIILIAFSWVGGLFRMGALVLLTHEGTDIPLLLGKIGRYMKMQKSTDIMFGIFILLWIFTRLTMFPFWILRTCFFHMPAEVISPAVYLQYGLGCIILVLNLVWSYTIGRIVYCKLVFGSQVKDIREDDSEEEDVVTSRKND